MRESYAYVGLSVSMGFVHGCQQVCGVYVSLSLARSLSRPLLCVSVCVRVSACVCASPRVSVCLCVRPCVSV